MKFRYKIFIFYTGTSAFLFLIVASVLSRLELKSLTEAKKDKLNAIGSALLYPARLFFMTGDTTSISKAADDLSQDKDIEFLGIYSKDGIYRFIKSKRGLEISDSLVNILRSKKNVFINKVKNALYISIPVYISEYQHTESFLLGKSGGKRLMGTIILSISHKRIRSVYLPTLNFTIFIFMIAFFTGFFIILFFYREVSSRMVDIEKGVRRIREGDFNTRINVKGEDEFALFSETLNNMAISIQKRIEEVELLNKDLQKKANELEKANRRILEEEELRKEFFTNVTHELKTPLQVIEGFVELCLKDELEESVRKRLQTIKKNTERLTNIVNNLLMLKTKRLSEFKKVDIKRMIEEIVHQKEKDIHKKGLIFNISMPEYFYTLGDESGLKTVFTHIIDNAIKFSRKGTISISGKAEGELDIISISDHGIGIKKEELKKIKIPFYQVQKGDNRKYKGLGIGLNIAELIIKAHKGEIEIYSKENKGTTVTVKIPQGK